MNINSVLKKANKVIINSVVMFFSITCVYPFFWTIYSSLKSQKEFSLNIMSLPTKLNFENYQETIFNTNIFTALFNSAFLSIVSIIFIILLGFTTAYLLSRFDFKGRSVLYIFYMTGMLIPVHSLLVPVFIQFKNMGLLDKRIGLLFPYIAFGLPMTIFLIESYIKSIPVEVEEAALIDGSNLFQRLAYVVFPMCKPVLSTALILSFLGKWNEFPFALILIRSSNLKTIPLWLTQFTGRFSTDYPQLMAALVMASLPVIIVYILFYKQVIKGMTAGAVKG